MYNTIELAKQLNIQYRSIKKIIEKYYDDFKMFGEIKIIKGQTTKKGGRPRNKIYILNNNQKDLLIIYLGNHTLIRKKKQNLIKKNNELI
jgi:phage regulator Rha-like protein